MVCRNIVGILRFFSWRGVGDMIVKYATIEAVNLCTCNASGFCAPVTHDASEVVMTFWHLQHWMISQISHFVVRTGRFETCTGRFETCTGRFETSHFVVRNADPLYYSLSPIFLFSASAKVNMAVARAFWMGFISFCGRIAEAYNRSSGLKAVLIIVLLLLLLFYSESSIDFNMQTQQDSPKFSKLW